jgi:uncharacterized protein (TIGR02453 family)
MTEIMKKVMDYLAVLQENNNREWFRDNKKRYDECRDIMLFVSDILISEIRKFDPEIPVTSPGDCLFRIYRDVRFSNDKRPYKTHFGSFIARGGRNSERAGYYIHLEPGGSFMGGGIYQPGSAVLKAIRTAIYDQPETFQDIINQPGFRKYFPSVDGEKLKTNPKGFPPEFQHMELLKYKSYVFSSEINSAIFDGDNFIGHVTDAFRMLHPANRFLNDALDNYL